MRNPPRDWGRLDRDGDVIVAWRATVGTGDDIGDELTVMLPGEDGYAEADE